MSKGDPDRLGVCFAPVVTSVDGVRSCLRPAIAKKGISSSYAAEALFCVEILSIIFKLSSASFEILPPKTLTRFFFACSLNFI